MSELKSQINHRTLNIIFIGAEAIVSIILIVLIVRFAETTSSMMSDFIRLYVKLFLAASIPIWGLGAFHLNKIGKMANYLQAFFISLGILLLLTLISAFVPAIPFIYLLSLVSVIIVFNYFALK